MHLHSSFDSTVDTHEHKATSVLKGILMGTATRVGWNEIRSSYTGRAFDGCEVAYDCQAAFPISEVYQHVYCLVSN